LPDVCYDEGLTSEIFKKLIQRNSRTTNPTYNLIKGDKRTETDILPPKEFLQISKRYKKFVQ
jgi:hypothetical protein